MKIDKNDLPNSTKQLLFACCNGFIVVNFYLREWCREFIDTTFYHSVNSLSIRIAYPAKNDLQNIKEITIVV